MAIKTNYGYEVKDLTDTIIMNLLTTAAEGVYIVKGQDAIIFKDKGQWKISSNDGISVTTAKVINLKFQQPYLSFHFSLRQDFWEVSR